MHQPDIKILANTIDYEESRVAIVEDGRLRELFIERMWERQKSGEIYKARVESILPGMNAAFVALGDGRNGFLYLKDAQGIKVQQNMDLLVQVVKTARKNKGARVTARISLPGRFLVLVPGGREVGVSKRITGDDERRRLRTLVKSLDTEDFGVILRTAALGAGIDAVEADLEGLKALWREIQRNAKIQLAPCLLYRDLGLTGRVLRDELTGSVSEIVADNAEEYQRILDYLGRYAQQRQPDVTLYKGATPLLEYYDVEKEIQALLDPKVWLPSGGYLVIDQTEALTVIDVNTGKYVGGRDLQETVLATNLEAADEIARQLRLRAIGGIVVVDFIDMELEENRQCLLRRLKEAFAGDRCKVRFYGISPLGLVEMTRKRARTDLRTLLTRPCPVCGSHSRVLKEDEVALALKRFLRKVFGSSRVEAVLVDVNPEIGAYVAEVYQRRWEEDFQRRILLRGLPGMGWEKFRLCCQGPVDSVETRAALGRSREEQIIVYRTADP